MSVIDRQMSDWRETFMLQKAPHFLAKIEDCLNEAKKLIGEEDSLLDVGCGRGYVREYLGHKNYLGVDLNEGEIAEARALFPDVNFKVGDLFELTEQHDVVLCSRLLIHIAPLEGAIRKLLSLTRKRLIIIMAVGPDDLREAMYDGRKAYMRSVSQRTLESFGACRIIPGNKYSLVVYEH